MRQKSLGLYAALWYAYRDLDARLMHGHVALLAVQCRRASKHC